MNNPLNGILDRLKEKNVAQITNEEASELLGSFKVEKEQETGIVGPIKILQSEKVEKKLILEVDQKNNNFIRFIDSDDIQEFVKERLSVYDKMWDGCGCKVFYDEVWTPVPKEKNIEI